MKLMLGIVVPALLLAQAKPPKKPAELFDAAKIWTIHLHFDAAQFEAMEPKGGNRGPGGPGGPNVMIGPGGPGGPGRQGGRMFGPSMMLAPAFLKADLDGDGKVSRSEFEALSQGWFRSWDRTQAGKLNEEALKAGLSTLMGPPPGMQGGPGGPGGGPGGPGGPGGGRGMFGPEGGRNGASAMSGIEFKYVHADLEFEGKSLKDVAVRYKGNSTFMQSRNTLKKSMKIDLNKYTKGQKLVGLTTLNLHSNVTDGSWMKEPLSYRLFRDGKVPSPRTSYAKVYLTVDGKYERQYLGLYSVVEDIDKEFAEEHYGSAAGAIFKPSTRNLFGYLGDDWKKYRQMYDPKTELTEAEKQRVIAMAKLVTDGSDEEFASRLAEFVDVDETARYLAINVWLANMDSILAMGQNYYMHLDKKTQKFQLLPWDLDLSFGGMGGGSELSIEHPWRGENKFLERLFKVEAFRTTYLKRMGEYNTTIFKPERIAAMVDETAAVIREAVQAESKEKAERLERAVRGEGEAPRGGGPGGGPGGGFGGPGGPGGGTPVRTYVVARAKSVAAQLAGESKGQQGGGMGGPGGPMLFQPGQMLAPVFLKALDGDQDRELTREEFSKGMAKLFDGWGGMDGSLSADQIRAGIEKDFPMPMPGPGPGMRQGPPPPPQE